MGLAVLFPVALLLILSAVQGGLWWHAHAVATQAAQTGADAGRSTAGTTGTAAQAARSFAVRAGSGVLATSAIYAVVTTEASRVTVSGTATRLLPIPGLDLRVETTARTARERFTLPDLAGAHP